MTFFNTGTRRVFRLFLSSLVWVMLPDAIAQTGPLTIVKSGSGTGTVTTTPAGIDCGVTCTASLSSFTLHAAPDPGSIFSGWVDAPCSGTGDCTINAMPNPRTIKAVFSAGTVVLTVQSNEFFFASGVVTSSPGEISCGFVCVYAFPAGTTVTLTATPRPGSQLAGWFGDGVNCPGTENCAVTLTNDLTVIAGYSLKFFSVSVVRAGTGNGGVTTFSSPAIDCGILCSSNFTYSNPPTLIASPIGASVFAGWSGGGCTGTGTCSPTVNVDSVVTATFTLVPPSAPPAPTIGGVIAGDGRGSISFLAPANDNGSPIIRYDVSCDGGTYLASGTYSPITVKGIPNNGLPHDCTVAAINAFGPSPPSGYVSFYTSGNPSLQSVKTVSRKRHGNAGDFDLVLSSPPYYNTTDPRIMGPFHEIVSEFNRPLASADISNIRASNASGSLPAPRIETATLDAILSIKIFDLPDGATIEFALTIDGTNVSSHVLQFLVGDLNRTKWVNAVDIVATKAIRGSPVNIGNFVYDVNLTGAIDDADVSLIKSRSGKTLVP